MGAARSGRILVILKVNAQRVAVTSTDWLDDMLPTKSLFHEIMCSLHLPLFFGREVVTAEAFNILQRVEQLEFLICMRQHRRVCA